jgi:hypothetical protein
VKTVWQMIPDFKMGTISFGRLHRCP